jgi:thymidylate synthase (FAD)
MEMLGDGICPEQARFVLPQGAIVNWIWTGNLVSFANFYNKRTEAHAQKEVGDVAIPLGSLVEQLFPVSWKALTTQE